MYSNSTTTKQVLVYDRLGTITPPQAHLNATDSRMARSKCDLVVEGFRPIKAAQAAGSFKGAWRNILNILYMTPGNPISARSD